MTLSHQLHDLRTRAPRSARVRLGGFAHLPRLIDKARAQLAGTLGDYLYGDDSLLDMELFKFIGLSPDAFLTQVGVTTGDWAILQWVQESAQPKLRPHEVQAWSHWIENLPGLSIEARSWFAEFAGAQTPSRPDIGTLFEYLDLDDYLRFGGQA
ncbi:DUF5069 domain-containing protein [Ruficoccus sp. ZRK36]|uniref:DUF5069 domain-containing protein n=1 Tax=Ruficoccus sp. ZRK36 TaxID=2866311 RepID=UPI001C738723|nr:DUF5069 domain-containing protein [Ruficoccus sp. ZRK36]QYY34320.1 DUF5069 domain-containing protein [Ruficoccus sp. ZRK36]